MHSWGLVTKDGAGVGAGTIGVGWWNALCNHSMLIATKTSRRELGFVSPFKCMRRGWSRHSTPPLHPTHFLLHSPLHCRHSCWCSVLFLVVFNALFCVATLSGNNPKIKPPLSTQGCEWMCPRNYMTTSLLWHFRATDCCFERVYVCVVLCVLSRLD